MVSYVYEPDSYVPLARLDATGASTEAGGLGTTADPVAEENLQAPSAPSAHPTAATSYQNNSNPANDGGGRDWQALQAGNQVKPLNIANGNHRICEVFYFHTDQVGLPEELTNSQGKLCWQASYKTWGSTVAEEWEVRSTAGQAVNALDEGSKPTIEQNLRFQGQYLDRDTGLHYNTFRFYDSDIGRFISPDPIGLDGGINLGSYSPNPISWVDPWGWSGKPGTYGGERGTHTGGETNHSPAYGSYKTVPGAPSRHTGPAFHMDKADHRAMTSTGSSNAAKAWRARQNALIRQGRWDKAMEMDIRESKQKYGSKYTTRMQRMVREAFRQGRITGGQRNSLLRKC